MVELLALVKKNRLDEIARRRNTERRISAMRSGYCPRCGVGPVKPHNDPDELVKQFRCSSCRHFWSVQQ